MFKRILILALCSLGLNATADELALKANAPTSYVVVKGDTLWDISETFLDFPWLWPEIWELNPEIENPHLIYPGDIIAIVWRDGQQYLTNNGRGTPVGTNSSGTVGVREISPDGTIKLSPQVRQYSVEDSIPAIPRAAIAAFLSKNRIVTEAEMDAAPYIIAGNEGRIVIGQGDTVFIRGNWDANVTAWDIFRKGKAVIDPKTQEFLGFEAMSLGGGNVGNSENGIAEFEISKSYENIRIGDRLLQSEEAVIAANYMPSAPDSAVSGSILRVDGGVNYVGQYDVVMINLGARDGLTEGNVLKITRNGDVVKDPITGEKVKLPSYEIGVMMVFKTFEKLSYGLVMKATSTISIGDYVTSPN